MMCWSIGTWRRGVNQAILTSGGAQYRFNISQRDCSQGRASTDKPVMKLEQNRWVRLHRCDSEASALGQGTTAEGARRIFLTSVPVAVPDVGDQGLYASRSGELVVIIANLANELHLVFINDRADTIRAANSPFCNPAGFSGCLAGRLAFLDSIFFDVFASIGRTCGRSGVA